MIKLIKSLFIGDTEDYEHLEFGSHHRYEGGRWVEIVGKHSRVHYKKKVRKTKKAKKITMQDIMSDDIIDVEVVQERIPSKKIAELLLLKGGF